MAEFGELYSPPDLMPAGTFLGRYRRPVWRALAEAYVAAWSAPGDLVLDPFCQDATVIRAAAALGRRAVAITGNPLVALLVRVEAAPPAAAALEAALQQIRYAPKVDSPLGDHLDQLYETACGRCQRPVPASAFVWDRGTGTPVLREYTCPECRQTVREPMPATEATRHLAFAQSGFHRHYVAERLRSGGGHERLQERLLGLYTPRNLYALTTLALKVEVLFAASPLLGPLRAVLMHTMDVASKLNLATEEGWRPVRSLQVPRHYREVNVWRAFAEAVAQMAAWPRPAGLALAGSLAQAAAPGATEAGLAYVGVESLAQLAAQLGGQVALALSQLPRFDPTFAALSYLWSGWLLGKEGARAAERLLGQRSPEGSRYLRALQSALGALSATLSAGGRAAFVFQAPATRYVESLFVAGGMAGLTPVHSWHGMLDDAPAERTVARRAEHHLVFSRRADWIAARESEDSARCLALETAVAVLRQRAEPTPFTALHGPIWDALARSGQLAGSPTVLRAEEWRERLGAAVGQALADGLRSSLALLAATSTPEAVTWWLLSPPPGALPLADRLEAAVREILAGGQAIGEVALIRELLRRLPGALVPSWPLMRACFEAYGTLQGSGQWVLAEEEKPPAVLARHERLLGRLAELGPHLGYTVAQARVGDLAWLEAETVALSFLVRDTAEWADLRTLASPGAGRWVIVIPERRVGLWRHKLAVAPQWPAERAGWAFLREAELDRLLREPGDRASFVAALGLGPERGEGTSQISLFPGEASGTYVA